MKQSIKNMLEQKEVIINDGAAGTHLESMGCDLNDKLWTAKVLKDSPGLIKKAHVDYFRAGADCGMSVSYQATLRGLIESGCSYEEAKSIIKNSVNLLKEARDEWFEEEGKKEGRVYPLITAAVGPYGAYLADGSEYRGDYKIDEEGLIDFHKERMEILWNEEPDLFAIETIPSLKEAIVLAEITKELGAKCWLTFSCKSYDEISDGTKIRECVKELEKYDCVETVGVNCSAPKYISSLIEEIQKETKKPITIYANSGKKYDSVTKTWSGAEGERPYVEYAKEWKEKGAKLIGGCCGTIPADIADIKREFDK